MADPQTKAELIDAIKREHLGMEKLLTTLSEAQQTAPILDEGWSIKDSLSHLVDWENMMLGWVESALRGVQPTRFTPDFVETEGDDNANMLRLNEHLYRQKKDRPLQDVLADFRSAHERVVAELSRLNQDDIFGPDRFPWRNGNPLLGTVAGNTYGHYEEHMGWIKTGLQQK
jgi:hypothetical protein